MRLQPQTLADDFQEWRGQIDGHHRLAIWRGLALRQMLRQNFDQSHPQRPNVGSRRQHSAARFGWIVRAGPSWNALRFSDPRTRVARKLQMVSSCQNICGLQVAMHKSPAMKVFQRIQNRP
jgi:hypothetical protein